ncbi:MAG: TIGR02391 family protein [Dehalococcoidia bacterium]|nr:TIGR02391 family protein [Dehalococcoidia bacterium]
MAREAPGAREVDHDGLVEMARELQQALGAPRRAAQIPDGLSLLDVLVTHPSLVPYVRPLFRDGHYARAVEEGQKALIAHVQDRASSHLDGVPLMLTTFSEKKPLLAVNDLVTRVERDEQLGYMHILEGMVLMARNVRAHNHRQLDTAEKALSLLHLTDHLFQVVDAAVVPAGQPKPSPTQTTPVHSPHDHRRGPGRRG